MKASKDLLVKGIAMFMAGILFFRTIPGTVAASETLSDPTEASVDYIETVEEQAQTLVDSVDTAEEAGQEDTAALESMQAEEETYVESGIPQNQTSPFGENEELTQNSTLSPEEIQAFQEKVRIWKSSSRIDIIYDSAEDISLEYSIFTGVDDSPLYNGWLQWDEQNRLYYASVGLDVPENLVNDESAEEGNISDMSVKIVLSDGFNEYEEIVLQENCEIVHGNIEKLENGRYSVSWESTGPADGYLICVKNFDGRMTLAETGALIFETEVQFESKVMISAYRMDGSLKYFGRSIELALSDSWDTLMGDSSESEMPEEQESIESVFLRKNLMKRSLQRRNLLRKMRRKDYLKMT